MAELAAQPKGGTINGGSNASAFSVLRASSRRLLLFIEQEVARNGGGTVTIYADQFRVVGSVRVVLPGLAELSALGLIEMARFPKRHVVSLSNGWRGIVSRHDAIVISEAARAKRPLPVMTQPQPAMTSINA